MENNKNSLEKETEKPLKYNKWTVGIVKETPQGEEYYATPWQFVKRMAMVAYESLRHSFYNSYIDSETENVRRE